MKKNFFKACLLLLLIALGAGQAWADQGPWKHYGMRYGWWSSDHSRSYNAQDQSLWGGSWTMYDDVNGMHWYNTGGTSGGRYMQSFHMIAYTTLSVPSFSRCVKTYIYDINSHTTQYYLTTNVLFFDDLSSAQTTGVSMGQNVKDSKANGYYYNTSTGSSWHCSADFYATLTFDNSTGSGTASISKYMLLVNCATNKGNDKRDVTHEAGFRHRGYNGETWYYYKYIYYYPNGGTGNNLTQTVVSSSSSTYKAANTYSRKNHIFAGWNSNSAGTGANYSAGGSVSASSSSKGYVYCYAKWTPIKFTLMNGNTQIAQFNASDNLTQLSSSYKPAAGAKQFFCGYYTQAGGKGIQVYDSNLNPTTAGQNQNFTANTTLYAHFITTQHTATWDYTYRDGNEYKNLDDHNRYCRLQFKDGSGVVIKNVYLTASVVENVTGPTSSNHTTSSVVVDLAVGTAADITNAANAKIYFTQAQLESMRGYQFDVWTTADAQGQKASLWVTTTNASAHTTTFNYGQLSENMFMLKWNVTLHNLMMYPDKIYAKPMILVDGNYQEIDEMKNVLGEDCHVTSVVSNSDGTLGAGSYATYYGEYPVLKNETGSKLATYKVGMSGFYLAGSNYFLNQNEGHVSNDFVSGTGLSYQDDTQDKTKNTITYDIYDYNIPVVLLLPANPALKATDASINYLDKVLYVDEARAGKVNLSYFVAERPHFNFLGWYDTEWIENGKNKIWGANEDYVFHTHTNPNGGTRTIFALWDRDSKPEASVEMTTSESHINYIVTATDAVEVKAVKYLIQDSTEAAPTAQTEGWTVVTGTNDQYPIRIDRRNDQYGKILYVLVQNETRDSLIKVSEPIRSYWDIKANADPDSQDQYGNYTYYSTFYDSQQSYKLNGEAHASVVASVDGGNLVINPLSSNAHGEVIIRKGTAVILSGAMDKLPLELVSEAYVELGDTPIKEVEKPENPENENSENNENTPQGESAPARTPVTPEPDVNILRGVDVDTSPEQLGGGIFYVLSYAQNGLGFYQNVPGRDLVAHKAFFTMSAAAAPRAFVFDLSDAKNNPIATAIENTEAETLLNGPVYNIYGQMVAPSLDQAENLVNGIYVVNGKKVVINK